MKTDKYVKKYNLNQVETLPEPVERELLKDLGTEFNDKIQIAITLCRNLPAEFSYGKFLHIIKEMNQKITNISNKKIGMPFPETLFSRFFAIYVIPVRENLFPVEHAAAQRRRALLTKQTENGNPKNNKKNNS